jgi:Holliday junction resolvase
MKGSPVPSWDVRHKLMPNRARQRGDYFERRTRAALEAQAWLVVRSAGSYGVADLVALKAGHNPLLVSCKLRGALPRRELHQLCDAAEMAGAYGCLARWLRPGWVGLEIVTRHGNVPLPDLRMPPSRLPKTAVADGLSPAGEQMALPFE